MHADIQSFFDEATSTVTYLVGDPETGAAAIIDPVLDFDPKAARTSTVSVDKVLAAADQKKLKIAWVLETHAHADHLSAAHLLKERTGAKIAIGEHIKDVQNVFRPIFNATDIKGDGAQFDRLLKEGETITIGNLRVEVLYTPGHTPACVSYKIGNDVFIGDTLFMPDYGTARADFPGGDAHSLYRSIRKLLALPDETTLWLCHDYTGPGRDTHVWKTTVKEQREKNVHVHDGVSEEEFVAMRTARDKTLAVPVLILPSVQVNIRAGEMPPADSDGNIYLRLPVNRI